jgi:O-antigen ligase
MAIARHWSRGTGPWSPASPIKVPLTPRFGLVLVLVCLLQLAVAREIVGSSSVPVLLAALAVFVLASIIEPRIAFIAPLCYLLLSMDETGAVTLADAIILLGPAVVICSALAHGDIARRAGELVKCHAFKVLIGVFVVFVVIAGVKGITTVGGDGTYQPLRLAIVPVVLLGLSVFRDREELRGALRLCFYAFTFYEFWLSLFLLATGGTATSSTVSTGGERAAGNSTAMFAVMAFVLIALHLGTEDRLGRRIGLSALMGMDVVIILLSLARASWAAGGVVVLVLVVLAPAFRRGVARFLATAAPVIVLLALLAPVVAPDQIQYVRDRVSTPEGPVQRDQSAVTREKSWSLMLDVWREAPLFGKGFGQSVSFTANDESTKTVVNDPHNGFIFLLASMGIAGLTAFLLVQIGFIVMAARAIRAGPIAREIAIWVLAAWFVYVVNAFLGVLLIITTFSVFLWVLIAIPVALAALPERAAPADETAGEPAASSRELEQVVT